MLCALPYAPPLQKLEGDTAAAPAASGVSHQSMQSSPDLQAGALESGGALESLPTHMRVDPSIPFTPSQSGLPSFCCLPAWRHESARSSMSTRAIAYAHGPNIAQTCAPGVKAVRLALRPQHGADGQAQRMRGQVRRVSGQHVLHTSQRVCDAGVRL